MQSMGTLGMGEDTERNINGGGVLSDYPLED
jgi:hypothetical protein